MATYDTSDIRKGLKIMIDGAPFTVVEFQFVKPGKGAAFTRTKIKNLLTGAVLERNFRSGEKFEPANVESRKMQYLFKDQNGYTFMDTESYEQVALAEDIVGDVANFLMDQLSVDVLFYNERAVGVTLPSHIVMTITECEPGVKGDTATNATKAASVETGHKIQVPLFIREGDKVKIDTRTGAYVERINT